MTQQLSAQDLARERTYLIGIAYRMLGSASDAEDVVQEALVRGANAGEMRSPRAFLTTVVTRLCLDELGSARRRRETYVGPDLPEPVPTDALAEHGEQRESLTLALLVVLDRLSPLERAVFVLRDVFELEFGEIAQAVGRSSVACRKLLSRAREHIERTDRSPLPPSAQQHALANAFFAAAASGDLEQLVQLLAEQATLETDHGGKASAARNVLRGAEVVGRFFCGLARKNERDALYRLTPCALNGAPALVVHDPDGAVFASFTLEISQLAVGARVSAVHVTRNPDKLVALRRALEQGFSLPLRAASEV